MNSEALFLAQELDAPLGTVISSEVDRRSAAELRRLHALNQDLLNAVRFLLSNPDNRISAADINAAEAVLAKVKS